MSRNVYLVGSVPIADATEVFEKSAADFYFSRLAASSTMLRSEYFLTSKLACA